MKRKTKSKNHNGKGLCIWLYFKKQTNELFCSSKGTINIIEQYATAQGNLFAIHINNKSLVSGICWKKLH